MDPNNPEEFAHPLRRPVQLGFIREERGDDPITLLFNQLRPQSGILEIDDGHHYFIDGERVYQQGRERGGNPFVINGIRHRFIGQIEYGDQLGIGASGAVVRAKLDGHFMAEKEIRLHRTNLQHIRELQVIRNCRECPQIVDYYGYTINGERLSIYMERMDISAADILKLRFRAANLNAFNNAQFNIGFPEQIISKLTLEIVKGLHYLKSVHRTIHRDLHPGNILLDRHGNIKLCDFGISGRLNNNSIMESFTRGCLEYLAPERLREGADNQNPYGAPADVWSLGIVLVHLARGTNPYMIDTNVRSLNREIQMRLNDPPRLQEFEGFSFEFRELVERCLQVEPLVRPRFEAILKDPFVLQGNEVNVNYVGRWVNEQLDRSQQKMEN